MKTFKDMNGRSWSLSITIGSIKRVKGELDVDLLALDKKYSDIEDDTPLITKIALDIELFCNILYMLIKPQADELDITDEQFGASLGGEGIFDAQAAFYAELSDFFQGLGRSDLVAAIKAQEKIIKLSVEKVEKQIAGIDLEKTVETLDLSMFGKSSIDSPE